MNAINNFTKNKTTTIPFMEFVRFPFSMRFFFFFFFRPSESATTVLSGHGTKQANYNEKCSWQNITNSCSKGNHVAY